MSQAEKKRSSRTSVDENAETRHSSRHSSRRSNYGGSISDIEADDNENYRKMAKKLARDKSDLKDKLRRLLDEVEIKTKEHRVELEKTQDYFQDQINDLVEERDKAREEIETMREALLEEKEKVREQFEHKLAKQKETIEKRYGGKDSQVIKRLENTIATLQDRLSQQIEEREHVKDTAEQFYNQKEEQLRKTISDLEEQIQKMKEATLKDRRDLQILTKTYTDEKEQIIRKMRQEKDEEISQVVAEKNNAVLSLQNIRDQVEKRTQELDRRRDAQIAQAKQEVEYIRADYERKHNEFIQAGRKSLEENKDEFERKFSTAESRHKSELDNMIKEHEKIVKNLTSENSRKIDVYTYNVQREVEDYKKNIATLQEELATTNEKTAALLAKKEDELRRNIERCNNEYQHRFEEKEKELVNLRLKNDKISGESEETVQRLREQLAQVRDSMKKLQDNSISMNNQFITNLNKQKELADKEISTRDQTIAHLERQVRKIGEESVDRFNNLERRIRVADEDTKDINGKYFAAKTMVEKHEQTINSMRTENLKLREAGEKLHETLRQMQFERGMAEQKAKAESDQKCREFEIISGQYEDAKKKVTAFANSLAELQQQIKNSQGDADKNSNAIATKDREIESLTRNLNNANGELVRVRKIFSDELQQKLAEVKADREKQIAELNKKLFVSDAALRNIERMSSETRQNVVTITLERDRYKAIADTAGERERLLNEANKKVSGFEQIVRNNEQTRQQLEHRVQLAQDKQKLLTEAAAEKDRQIGDLLKKCELTGQGLSTVEQARRQLEQEYKTLLEKYKQLTEASTGDLNVKMKEIQKLQEEIGRLKTNFASTLNSISIEMKEKDTELRALRSRINECEEKEAKFGELNNNVSSSQQEFRATVEKLAAESRRDKEEITALKMKEAQYSRQTEEIDVLKKALDSMKAGYEGILARVAEEKKSEISIISKRLAEAEQQVSQHNQKVETMRQEFGRQLADAKKLPVSDKNKMEETEKENIRVQGQLEMSEKKLGALQAEYAQAVAGIRAKQEQLKEREEEVKKNELSIRNAPPKLMDPSIRKARDDALANLRQSKIELTKAKDESIQLTQKLTVAEGLVKDLEREKQLILKAQSDLKETFVNNLNQQQEKHEKEMTNRSDRIKELERMLTEKLKQPE
jgi:chromosome segregation ATPase